MNAFYLWLQNEVNTHDLNASLYRANLHEIKESPEILKDIEIFAQEVLDQIAKQETDRCLDTITLSVQNIKDSRTHALFNPNTQSIVINARWLDFLKNHMSETDAVEFCRTHELSHALEFKYFNTLKRKARIQACEVLAKRVSQKSINAPYHPSIYEYRYGLDNGHYTQTELITYLKGALKCDL